MRTLQDENRSRLSVGESGVAGTCISLKEFKCLKKRQILTFIIDKGIAGTISPTILHRNANDEWRIGATIDKIFADGQERRSYFAEIKNLRQYQLQISIPSGFQLTYVTDKRLRLHIVVIHDKQKPALQ